MLQQQIKILTDGETLQMISPEFRNTETNKEYEIEGEVVGEEKKEEDPIL